MNGLTFGEVLEEYKTNFENTECVNGDFVLKLMLISELRKLNKGQYDSTLEICTAINDIGGRRW